MRPMASTTTTTAGGSTSGSTCAPSYRYPAGGADERKLRRGTQNTGHSRTIIVFLDGGMEEPDTMSLELLKSGDIESNPGPTNRSLERSTLEHCGKCRSHFTNNSKPLTCLGCSQKFCRSKFACTGTTRWKIDKLTSQGTGWSCMRCTARAKNTERAHAEASNEDVTTPTLQRNQISHKSTNNQTTTAITTTKSNQPSVNTVSVETRSEKELTS